MLPLTEGAGYKLFGAKMLPLTEGAGYKLFGAKMLPHPFIEMGLFLRCKMLVNEGYFYHIRDEFFSLVQDRYLMANKENGAYRPHYLAVQDSHYTDIYWMIPVSSKVQKFRALCEQQKRRYGVCTKIVLGECGGQDAAFLIQNAFPVTSDYFDHVHTINNVPVTLHFSTRQQVIDNLRHNLRLKKRGVNLFFPDIDKIYQLMQEHLSLEAL